MNKFNALSFLAVSLLLAQFSIAWPGYETENQGVTQSGYYDTTKTTQASGYYEVGQPPVFAGGNNNKNVIKQPGTVIEASMGPVDSYIVGYGFNFKNNDEKKCLEL